MRTGEFLTRGTAWLALTLYVACEIGTAVRRARGLAGADRDRWQSTIGCAVFLAHVACAFNFYHDWSHAAAYTDTARQTAELIGWSWGGGLYINYVFGLVWVSEVIWSWTHSSGYLQRSSLLTWAVRGFFMFMIFNGAFVFAHGAVRWFGLILSLALAACWFRRGPRSIGLPDTTQPS